MLEYWEPMYFSRVFSRWVDACFPALVQTSMFEREWQVHMSHRKFSTQQQLCSLAADFRFHLYLMCLPLPQNFKCGSLPIFRELRHWALAASYAKRPYDDVTGHLKVDNALQPSFLPQAECCRHFKSCRSGSTQE